MSEEGEFYSGTINVKVRDSQLDVFGSSNMF